MHVFASTFSMCLAQYTSHLLSTPLINMPKKLPPHIYKKQGGFMTIKIFLFFFLDFARNVILLNRYTRYPSFILKDIYDVLQRVFNIFNVGNKHYLGKLAGELS